MKQFGFTLMLFVVVLSPLAAVCQRLPDEPQPAPAVQATASQTTQQPAAGAPAKPAPPDEEWRKIQRLVNGEYIVVSSTYGPALRCRFSGTTDDALFCDVPGSPEGTGYSFERPSVISVEATRPGRNHHPAWIASIIAGGLVTGLVATRTNDARDAATIGAVGALVVGAIGAPLAFLQPHDGPMVSVVYRPHAFKFHGLSLVGPRLR
jgi:hypothetical protein